MANARENASADEFWRRFARLPVVGDQEPLRALEELRSLRVLLMRSISELDEVLVALDSAPDGNGAGKGGDRGAA